MPNPYLLFPRFISMQQCCPKFVPDVIAALGRGSAMVGHPEKAAKVLASLDWTGAAPEFRLAKVVLEGDFEEACGIMEQVGEQSKLMSENSYYVFPVFREFRLQESFRKSYEKVFARPFVVKVQETADEAKIQLEQAAPTQSAVVADTAIATQSGSGEGEKGSLDAS